MERLRNPWLVAAWPGMGAVGYLAVQSLVGALEATRLKPMVESSEFFVIDHVHFDAGVLSKPSYPDTAFYAWRNPDGIRDLLFATCEAQPSSMARGYCTAILEAVKAFGVERVVTFAAMAATIDPRSTPRVLAVTTLNADMHGELKAAGAEIMDTGDIAGLNGLLPVVAAQANVPGAILLGEFPYFAASLPNVKSSHAVLKVFSRFAGIRPDLSGLEQSAAAMEEKLSEVFERLVATTAAEREEAEDDDASSDERPALEDDGARARIESLFSKANKDRSAAAELKAELDRLGVFKPYEDRFLDLFRRSEGA